MVNDVVPLDDGPFDVARRSGHSIPPVFLPRPLDSSSTYVRQL